jgi:two-component system cell cycle sensor histidine kinase/response regulator CckA
MSGPELVKRLGSLHPEAKTLFISGYTRAFKPVMGGAQPAPFLAKPFTPHALALKVREVLAPVSPTDGHLPVKTEEVARDT